ncbi:MAG: hypothetical protein AABW80_03850 [Nanoarchaeota archaeon]
MDINQITFFLPIASVILISLVIILKKNNLVIKIGTYGLFVIYLIHILLAFALRYMKDIDALGVIEIFVWILLVVNPLSLISIIIGLTKPNSK